MIPAEIPLHERVSSRLLVFVFDLLRHRGVDPRALAADCASIGTEADLPEWVTWDDYITMIHRLGEVAGGAAGVAASMRATLPTAHADMRALTGFFAGPIPYYAFVTHHLMRELIGGVRGEQDLHPDGRVRLRYRIDDRLQPSLLYCQGTLTLFEVFPTHFDLPEAKVEIVRMTDRECELLGEISTEKAKSKVTWGEHVGLRPAPADRALTPREQQVLGYVCEGLTNAEIATALGTSPSTVKNQISSILAKMDVANRTELAARFSRAAV